jgi:hypothetical protein
MISADTMFRRHASQRAVIRKLGPARFEVLVWGRSFDINHCEEELLKGIFSRVAFSMSELVVLSPGMSFSGVTEVMRVFVREGIVDVAL